MQSATKICFCLTTFASLPQNKLKLWFYTYLRGGRCGRSLRLSSLGMGGFPGSLGSRDLTAPPPPPPLGSLGMAGDFPISGRGFEGLACSPTGGEGLGTFFIGGLSLRGGGMAPGFSGMLREGKDTFFFFLSKQTVMDVLTTRAPTAEPMHCSSKLSTHNE